MPAKTRALLDGFAAGDQTGDFKLYMTIGAAVWFFIHQLTPGERIDAMVNYKKWLSGVEIQPRAPDASAEQHGAARPTEGTHKPQKRRSA